MRNGLGSLGSVVREAVLVNKDLGVGEGGWYVLGGRMKQGFTVPFLVPRGPSPGTCSVVSCHMPP